ncbi:MAG: DJ-1/PfpI family protein [Mycobacterium sp.]
MLVDIVVYDGVDEMDAIGPLEVLRSAGAAGADLGVRLVTRTPQPVVTGAYGLRFVPDKTFVPGEADIIVVTGGGWAARADRGAWGEAQRGDWLPLLAEAAQTAHIVAAACTGSMLLAHAGVIGNRRAATHHTAWEDLQATGATLVKDRVVDDGDLVTSGGVTSGLDLALWLVEREFGRDLAERTAARMEYARAVPKPRSS